MNQKGTAQNDLDQTRYARPRALLDWTQGELAKRSGLSLRALNSIERGLAVPRIDNLRFIQEALEKENIEFGPHDGVRRKTERLDIVKLEGDEYLNQHLIDVIQEIHTPGTEVLYNLASEEPHAGIDGRKYSTIISFIWRATALPNGF